MRKLTPDGYSRRKERGSEKLHHTKNERLFPLWTHSHLHAPPCAVKYNNTRLTYHRLERIACGVHRDDCGCFASKPAYKRNISHKSDDALMNHLHSGRWRTNLRHPPSQHFVFAGDNMEPLANTPPKAPQSEDKSIQI